MKRTVLWIYIPLAGSFSPSHAHMLCAAKQATPLHLAAATGHCTTVSLLLENGVFPRCNPLHCATIALSDFVLSAPQRLCGANL